MTIVVMLSKNLWHERELQLCFLAHSLAMFLLHAEICLRPRMSLGCGVIFLTQEAMILLCHDTFARCKLLYTSCQTERRVCRFCDLSQRKGTSKQGLSKWWRYHLYILFIPFYTRCSAMLGCGVIYLTQEAMILLCHDTFAWCKLLYTSCETERRVYRPCDLILRKGTQNKDFRSGGDTTSTSSLFHPIHCVPQFCTTSPEPTQRQNYPIQAWRKASQLNLCSSIPVK